MKYNIDVETLVDLAKEVDSECPIDWGMIPMDEDVVYRMIWLLISPNKDMILIHGKIHQTLKSLGLSYSKLFKASLNTNTPVCNLRSPMHGWLFFNDEDMIRDVYER